MTGINAISGVGQQIRPEAITKPMAGKTPDGKGDFSNMLKGYIDKVNVDQDSSAAAIQDLLAGKTQDVLPVVSAVAQADLSFKLLLGVRNKVIEAYKQTMNMQI